MDWLLKKIVEKLGIDGDDDEKNKDFTDSANESEITGEFPFLEVELVNIYV